MMPVKLTDIRLQMQKIVGNNAGIDEFINREESKDE